MVIVMGDYIGTIASLITSLTVVGSALLWLYNKFIGAPRELKRTREESNRHRRMLELITNENQPLNESIKQLTEWLNESKIDRESLNRIAVKNTARLDEHEERLDNHNDRLITLEAVSRLTKR